MSQEDPTDEEGQRYVELLRRAQGVILELTDEEWMSIVARDRDGLPACCANISALRDSLIEIAREDGMIGFLNINRFAAALTWCFPSHEVPSDAIQKVLDQIGFEVPAEEDHVKDGER